MENCAPEFEQRQLVTQALMAKIEGIQALQALPLKGIFRSKAVTDQCLHEPALPPQEPIPPLAGRTRQTTLDAERVAAEDVFALTLAPLAEYSNPHIHD